MMHAKYDQRFLLGWPQAIESMYKITEVPFSVGQVSSEPGQNMGSSKILAFARLNNLDEMSVSSLARHAGLPGWTLVQWHALFRAAPR